MSFLHLNNPPTDNRAALARQALTKSLDSLDSKINCLRDRLSTLSLEQRRLYASLESCRGLLSPIRRLLPEILQEIFCHCLPTAHNAVMSAEEAPLLLGRVCSRWRRVAHSTPELWASIHIVATIPPHPSSPEVRQAIALRHAVAVWLSRSGTLPLSISLISFDFDHLLCGSMTAYQTRPYFDLVAHYAHRWRSIHFTVYRFHWVEFFDRFDASEVPLLESLHINSYNNPAPQDIIPTMSKPNSILRAPRLHALSIPSYSKDIPKLGIQLQNFTGLSIKDSYLLPPREIVKILGHCPNLRTCAISTWSPPSRLGGHAPSPVEPIVAVVIPKLESLAVSGGTSIRRYTNQLLKTLVTPALRHLSIPLPPQPAGSATSEPDDICGSLSSFLRHLIDPLEELQLKSRTLAPRSIADILSLVPGLKRLSFSGCRTSSRAIQEEALPSPRAHDFVLAQLTPGNDWGGICGSQPDDQYSRTPTSLCPKLEVLHYMNAEFLDNEFLDFLRSRTIDHRQHSVSHIRMVSVHFHRREQDSAKEMDLDLRRGIEALERKTGVRVDCRYNISRPTPGPRPLQPIIMTYSPFDGLPPTVPSYQASGTGSGYHYLGF
ncbi:hypothetical protein P691DRAFT_806405, partial [Macrolepiota fuliginosa MF-IS2]